MSSYGSSILRQEDRRPIGVLLVSPNASFRQQLSERLHLPRWLTAEASSGAAALEQLHEKQIDVLLLDPLLPDLVAEEFSAMVRERFPAIEVLSMNTHTGQLLVGSASPTPLASQLTDVLYRRDSQLSPLVNAPSHPMRDVSGRSGLRGMVGASEPMQRVFHMAHMVAPTDTTVLITGESGTGKDLVAQAIHMISPRQKYPFVVVNCAAIPEALLEAELFGYAKGAFTGALQSRIGRIPAAHGGTLFLDEIGDMPLSLQSKILRFLEQGEVQRLGGNDNLKVDVRVLAATNAELKQLAQQKLFREDLYYRLAVFPLQLPPLRERMGDLVDLAQAFTARFSPGAKLCEDAIETLQQHDWPGNVRELRNVLERASILAGAGADITARSVLL
ncbi:MAG TPA: sigma-54 dependent transcriptional regulator [Acidobacteriaceae bacterium]